MNKSLILIVGIFGLWFAMFFGNKLKEQKQASGQMFEPQSEKTEKEQEIEKRKQVSDGTWWDKYIIGKMEKEQELKNPSDTLQYDNSAPFKFSTNGAGFSGRTPFDAMVDYFVTKGRE